MTMALHREYVAWLVAGLVLAAVVLALVLR